MLLAESSGNFGFLLFLLLMVLGIRQWCIWIKGSPILQRGVKKGLGKLLSIIFKL